ncbi:MAG: M24 family metallopeptidase [Bacteroidetes bacterium]|jgi:Xaa-Pro aminopeptidase|nr:M24 family metallopeptidase [Bacteroidota bacterium]MBT4398256.1 M24 family metallopeptidase [Bacteroidota bacterium]MBT4409041.1 M24 family metallopeptidase [Bacteroidota bacterium]MBT5425524.1 M24 family metallopeptidase [Bacteroidota bacterium]MBT7093512.1 M24 family metallopeptidase [Bacteroidota bacterium]
MKQIFITLASILIVALTSSAQEYQTHFPKEEFQSRWNLVFDHIGDEAIAIVQGAEDPGGFVYPRQTNTFYYLCGVENSYAYLLLDGKTRTVTLFLAPGHSQVRERVLSLSDPEKVKQLTGVHEVKSVKDMFSISAPKIFTPFSPGEKQGQSRGEIINRDRHIASDFWDGRLSKEIHFIALLKSRNPRSEVLDLSPFLDEMRSIKSPREIELLRKAGELSAKAIIAAMKRSQPGVYEYQLDAEARYVFLDGGARLEGYRSITASGVKNIRDGHYYYNSSKLLDGDLVLMDFAPDYGYYTSDIGRMWPVNGKFKPWQRELCQWILIYHKEIISRIEPGRTPKEIMDEVEELLMPKINNTKFSKEIYKKAVSKMIKTGGGVFSHTVGMAVHDVGHYREAPLKEGQVFAVDPQLRIKEEGLYMRIEDTGVVTIDGFENFTALAPMELKDIEKIIGSK